MGAYTWIFFGFMPLGSLWTGAVAEKVGLSEAVVINGVVVLVIAVVLWFFVPKLREE